MALKEGLYTIGYYKTESIVELIWLAGTAALTDEDFREALTVFAEAALFEPPHGRWRSPS